MLEVKSILDDVIEIGYKGEKMGNHVDLLTPKECLQFSRDLSNALFEWSKLTKKRIDWENLK